MAIDAAALRVVISADSAPAERGIKSFSNKLNSAAKGFAVTGGILTGAITMPLLGIATNALSMAADFEQSMNVLQQVTGASTDTMAAMNDQALALGASTVFSAGEAAKAMLELGKAGMGTQDIMASIPGVMSLAAAGGIELGTAANLTANALNAFHLEASEAGRVADMLAAGANASSASIGDLGQGLQAAGFAFASANQPIENLVASLAILTNVGLTGSDAGTALKNALLRIMNPTAEASKLMKKLGINFYDAKGQMKAMPDIIDILNAAMGGMTDQQRDVTLSTLFMSDGMKAMIPLLAQGSTGFNKMVDKVSEAGAASDVAGARMKGLSGGIEYLSGSIDSFLIGAAQPFLGVLNGIVVGVADAITWFGGLPPSVILATEVFLGLAAAIGPLMLALGGIAFALASPLLPIGLLILGVAALGVAWATNFGGLQDITSSAITALTPWFTTLGTLLTGLATNAATAATNLASLVKTAFDSTKFPTLDELWKDFQAGDFDALATKIKTTAFDLMVNLDTELNITGNVNQLKVNAGKMRDDIFNGISNAIDGIDLAGGGKTFAGLINKLKFEVDSMDFSGIDWAATLQAVFVAPAVAAFKALTWVIGSESFGKLQSSVQTALTTIPWGDLTIATGGLVAAVSRQISAVLADMGGDLGLKMPAMKMPTINIDWGKLAIDTLGLVNRVTFAINNINWTSVGTNVGTAIVNAVTVGVTGIGAAIKGLNWANDAINSFKLQVLGLGLRIGTEIGTALRGINLFEASASLTASIQAALFKVFAGAVVQIRTSLGDLGGLIKLPTLKWPEFPKFTWPGLPVWAWPIIPVPDWIFGLLLGLSTVPAWVPTLVAWVPGTPEWVTSVLAWVPSTPGWITSMLAWSPMTPDWVTSMLSWIPETPDWVTSMLDWVPEMPGWVSRLLGWAPGFNFGGGGGGPGQDVLPGIPAGAAGFPNFRGGMALVGERGPELVDLPRGSRVYNHQDSMAMAGAGGGGGVTVQILGPIHLASDMDVEVWANRVARVIARKQH